MDIWDLLVVRNFALAPFLTTMEFGRLASCCKAFKNFITRVSHISISSDSVVKCVLDRMQKKQLPDLLNLCVRRPFEEVKALVAALGGCPKLKRLDLANNNIGDAEAEALAETLRQPGICPQLQQLDLRNNNIGGTGVTLLVGAFVKRRMAIPELDLRDNNKVGAAGARVLAVAQGNAEIPSNIEYLNELSDLGNLSMIKGYDGLALVLLKEVLELRRRSLPADDRDIAISLMDLALPHEVRGEYDVALALVKESLEIRRRCLPMEIPSSPIPLMNWVCCTRS